jgi:hypothetical protein
VYDLFTFLHIVGALVWVGAGATFQVLNARLAAARDHAGIAAKSAQGEWFGKAVFSTSAGVTLVAGVATVLASDDAWSFGDLWITWGFAGVALSIVFGAMFSERTARELAATVEATGPDTAQVEDLQRRLGRCGAIDLVILLSVVAAMVWKPGA